MKKRSISIIGAGLAGSEAALQLSKRGFRVRLFDSKPYNMLPAYKQSSFAELVCNNSFAPNSNDSPLGLLVSELREMGSEVIKIADKCRVDDHKYLAVDKQSFSNLVSKELVSRNIELVCKNVLCLPKDDIVIIASGPLTNEDLIKDISIRYNINGFHFSDASSVIIDISSVDLSNEHISKISNDLYMISIPENVFSSFFRMLNSFNETTSLSKEDSVDYEKCLSLERLANIGERTLRETRFSNPYSNGTSLLLRRESALDNGFILVGCMTTLRHDEQKRVFSLLPGFEHLKIIKYGRMHRNTFFDAPKILDSFFMVRGEDLYIVGQLSGTDGYAPAIASGLVAALRIIYGEHMKPFPRETMIGGLSHYVSNREVVDYQPMCASYSLLYPSKGMDYHTASRNALLRYKEVINFDQA